MIYVEKWNILSKAANALKRIANDILDLIRRKGEGFHQFHLASMNTDKSADHSLSFLKTLFESLPFSVYDNTSQNSNIAPQCLHCA